MSIKPKVVERLRSVSANLETMQRDIDELLSECQGSVIGDEIIKGFEEFVRLIKSGGNQVIEKWVSVDNRLPRGGGYSVLVGWDGTNGRARGVEGKRHRVANSIDPRGWVWVDDDGDQVGAENSNGMQPTHWRCLPEGPRAERKGDNADD